jgi:hypothetical protein
MEIAPGSASIETNRLSYMQQQQAQPQQPLQTYKYSQFAVPPSTQNSSINMIKASKFEKSSTPPNGHSNSGGNGSSAINANLAAATAAAAAAVAAVQQQQQQQQQQSPSYDSPLYRAKQPEPIKTPTSIGPGLASTISTTNMSLSGNLKRTNEQTQPLAKPSAQQPSTTMTAKSTLDTEMVSSPASSSPSSYKENKQPRLDQTPQQSEPMAAVATIANVNSENSDSSSSGSSHEPSKLSLSEKLKLFSAPATSSSSAATASAATSNTGAATVAVSKTPKQSSSKRATNRFQTQVIFILAAHSIQLGKSFLLI